MSETEGLEKLRALWEAYAEADATYAARRYPSADNAEDLRALTDAQGRLSVALYRALPRLLDLAQAGASRPVGGKEVQPRAVAAAEAKVREDAANTLHHSTDGDARLMCRVGARELGQVLAHYEHIKAASRPLGDREEGRDLANEQRDAIWAQIEPCLPPDMPLRSDYAGPGAVAQAAYEAVLALLSASKAAGDVPPQTTIPPGD